MNGQAALTLENALQVLANLRTDQVVITAMSAARQWMCVSNHSLDFNYIPSTMGGGFSLGLGIALAQPTRDVIVLNGDGCVLMNLGSLITAAVSRAENFTAVIIDNGNFETTGRQKLATSGSPIEHADFARAARFASVAEFDSLPGWKAGIEAALGQPGPRCIVLKVTSEGDHTLRSPGPMPKRIAAFRAALDG